MSDPTDFIDAEKMLARLESIEDRLARIEGVLEALAASCGIEYEPQPRPDARPDGDRV